MHFYLLQKKKKYLQEKQTSVTGDLGFHDKQFEQSFTAQSIYCPIETDLLEGAFLVPRGKYSCVLCAETVDSSTFLWDVVVQIRLQTQQADGTSALLIKQQNATYCISCERKIIYKMKKPKHFLKPV